MNVIDWLRETANYMMDDRPDLYKTHDMAVEELSSSMEELRSTQNPWDTSATMLFASYILFRWYDDGVEEWILTRKISSAVVYEEDEACRVYGHTDKIALPHILDMDDDDC